MDDLQYWHCKLIWEVHFSFVLNLVINGWPSIPESIRRIIAFISKVLNLVINGWPSILERIEPLEKR